MLYDPGSPGKRAGNDFHLSQSWICVPRQESQPPLLSFTRTTFQGAKECSPPAPLFSPPPPHFYSHPNSATTQNIWEAGVGCCRHSSLRSGWVVLKQVLKAGQKLKHPGRHAPPLHRASEERGMEEEAEAPLVHQTYTGLLKMGRRPHGLFQRQSTDGLDRACPT